MLNRLISQNKFTRNQIKIKTGIDVNNPIVVVGNTMKRSNVERSILSGKSIAIVGVPNCGKLTTILDICDRHNIKFFVSYDGSGFDDLPYRSNALFVIRYSGYKPIYKKYLQISQVVFLSNDDISPSIKKLVNTFYFRSISELDKKEYLRLKGEDFPIFSRLKEKNMSLLSNATQLLRGNIRPENYIPESEKIIAYSIDDPNVVLVCALANRTTEPLFKWGLMNLIKLNRPQLEYPPRLAKNDDKLQ